MVEINWLGGVVAGGDLAGLVAVVVVIIGS
jgi:hypothetical protein